MATPFKLNNKERQATQVNKEEKGRFIQSYEPTKKPIKEEKGRFLKSYEPTKKPIVMSHPKMGISLGALI